MRKLTIVLTGLFCLTGLVNSAHSEPLGCVLPTRYALVVHGGAGSWELSPAEQTQYQGVLKTVLETGYAVLKKGGSSLDAVQTAVAAMEDSGFFNAGKGSVANSAGDVEMDAAIMDGATGKAGAVGALQLIKNPIELARRVMQKTPHVLLVGNGAQSFASGEGITLAPRTYFINASTKKPAKLNHEYGTVGAVALDCHGHLAAATSTGGLSGKMPGRLGDTPIIGGGTYAKDDTCAVSATGEGEYFIRGVVAHDISAMMEYRGIKLRQAARRALYKVRSKGGSGGLISIDKNGIIAMPFSTPGMLRGFIREDGVAATFK